MEIEERREVRARVEGTAFVFVADPGAGRLVIREEHDDGDDRELCALTVEDREELRAFLTGLRRVLGVGDAPVPADEPPASPPAEDPALPRGDQAPSPATATEDAEDRDEQIRRARQRNPKAFAPWTTEEEDRVADAVRAGRTVAAIARELGRSQRAVEMRIERLGLSSS